MAHVTDGRGNKRDSNVDLNLVPFIDLMSVIITFLLITAVWTQVSMIKLGSSVYGKQQKDDPTPPLPKSDVAFRLDVKDYGYLVVIGKKRYRIEKQNGDYDEETLKVQLVKIKQAYPDKIDAVITMDEALKYDYLIRGMDVLLQSGFSAVSVATGGASN